MTTEMTSRRSEIPPSASTVSVSIIDTTASVRGLPANTYLDPSIPGHDYLAVPCFPFIIHHPTVNKTLLFDLGIRKYWQNLSPPLVEDIKGEGMQIYVEKDVPQILSEGGIDPTTVDAVFWSHYHFDHIGNMSLFLPSTTLIVGPGFKDKMLPGFPTDPDSDILETDYHNRPLKELDFHSHPLTIGNFPAIDYFSDGSFYILNAPGHTVGHICALARVTSNPNSFILMGADAANHGGELRPSPHLPFPKTISPHPFQPSLPTPCPGHIFTHLLQNDTQPFYKAPLDAHHDDQLYAETKEKVQGMDGVDNVLVV
ncbi:hypothetical protein HK097_005592 [Rhizophlyctis rosea]|uniref:Metallo-beta-lactamase domain-containing protein n=1 Tax=Rhizophlyctis rosea TaxID=64517 RepID=A0AAD5SEU9_9FUNG|nr:hypothetical protein HK097_005592 [Rhizophlyctis rosea]